ncbi:hypothetical protein [Phenylobacterium sp.]
MRRVLTPYCGCSGRISSWRLSWAASGASISTLMSYKRRRPRFSGAPP